MTSTDILLYLTKERVERQAKLLPSIPELGNGSARTWSGHLLYIAFHSGSNTTLAHSYPESETPYPSPLKISS